MGTEKTLEANHEMTGTMTHNILLTREKGNRQLTRGGVLKDSFRGRNAQEEEGRMTPTLSPFVWPGYDQMLCDPSVFCRIWFWP